ncbi:hypothetical protein B0H19DRAFT_309074 [Mycena capillaripes]|nr:hypothetical protein B0H19DRAFT_309074 [Mycena capillaripes]
MTSLSGGRGGSGGKSDNTGGGGGLGERPQLSVEDVRRFREITGGIGGDGGEGVVLGGTGGRGEGPIFSQQLVSMDGWTIQVPRLTVAEFCQQYKLSDKIYQLLTDEGFEMAGSLLEISDITLKEAKFKAGQIAELKRALKEFLFKNQGF